MRPLDAVPVEAPLIQYSRILPNADPLLFRKVDSFFGPSSTWTITDACMPLTQDRLPSLIQSTTRHYNSTGMHSTSFLIAFPVSVQQGRALERTSKVLKGTSMHAMPMPTENIPEASKVGDTSLLRTLQMAPMVSTL